MSEEKNHMRYLGMSKIKRMLTDAGFAINEMTDDQIVDLVKDCIEIYADLFVTGKLELR
jgi:PP-loop superfamily ATP-utilizing enzyme